MTPRWRDVDHEPAPDFFKVHVEHPGPFQAEQGTE
jgi:hypothetical protein